MGEQKETEIKKNLTQETLKQLQGKELQKPSQTKKYMEGNFWSQIIRNQRKALALETMRWDEPLLCQSSYSFIKLYTWKSYERDFLSFSIRFPVFLKQLLCSAVQFPKNPINLIPIISNPP